MRRLHTPRWLIGALALLLGSAGSGCSLITDSSQFLTDGSVPDTGPPPDGGRDAGPGDAGPDDGGPTDGGPIDGGPTDAGPMDGGPIDGGPVDGGPVDGGPVDAGPTDAGPTPPTVILLSGIAMGTTTNLSRAAFTYTTGASGTINYQCQLDSVTAAGSTSTGFVACSTSRTYDLLEAGAHTFSVRARADGGPFGPATTRSWSVEALSTAIRPIQEGRNAGTFDEETLVTFTARVQQDIGAFGAFPRLIALQDANAGTLSAGAWHGITAAPLDAGEPGLDAGRTVRVTGTVREVDQNTQIVGARFERMAAGSPYAAYRTRESSEVRTESMEGVSVEISGHVPSSSCSGPCSSPTGPRCLEACEDCAPLPHRNTSGDVDYGDYGFYTGTMVDTVGAYQLWVYDFAENGDACL